MQRVLKQSTAVDVLIGPFIDDTDFKTPETGLTLTSAITKLSKNGQSLASRNDATSCVHDVDGYYNCELDTTDTNTVGQLRLAVNVSGALPYWLDFFVLEEAAYDVWTIHSAQPTLANQTLILSEIGDQNTTLGILGNKIDTVDTVVDAIILDTAEIGTAGAGLTQVSLISTGLDAIVSTATGMVEIAKAICDRVLTGATHNITNSLGKRIRQISGIIFNDGTAQSGGNNSIQLASGAITSNDMFRRAKVILTGGTGAGQEAIITSTVASTDTCTVTPQWITNPDNTTEYEILPAQTHSTVRNGGYDNSHVYVDTINGVSGVEKGVNGTSTNKSSVMADAYTIAGNENINHFAVTANSSVTLPSDSTGKNYEGFQYTVALAGKECGGVEIHGANSVSGIALNTSGFNGPAFFLSGIGSVTLPPSNFNECGFFGTITVGTEGFFTIGSSSSVFGLSPIIDYGAGKNASGFFLQHWQGGQLTIKNYGVGTGTYQFEMSGIGDLVIDATCTGGSIIVRGNIKVTDNSGGAVTVIRTVNFDEIDAKIATGLSDIHLDHLFAVDYDPASKPGVGTALLNELIESDAGVSRYTANSLEQAPGGGGDATEAKQDTIIANLAIVDTNVDAIKVKTDNLPGAIPKGVALANFAFLLVDATDFATPETGRTVTATISKDGAAFGAMTNSVTEISNGMYKITVTASEMTADIIILRFAASGAADRFVTIKTDA